MTDGISEPVRRRHGARLYGLVIPALMGKQ